MQSDSKRNKLMDATIAAHKMMADRGYVVIGYEPGDTPCSIGEVLDVFAGSLLFACDLVVESPTDRADWDAQAKALFGQRRGSPAQDGQKFFRCRLQGVVSYAK